MGLQPHSELTAQDVERGLRVVVREGIASQTMATLTGGAFLVAFALKLGASNLLIGLLAAIPPLAQLLQIPSIYLVKRIPNRRGITLFASASSRVVWLAIAMIPLLGEGASGLTILAAGLLASGAFGAAASCAWNPWIHDLIPSDRLGSFFARRMVWTTAAGMVLSVGAALFIDHWESSFLGLDLWGYSILFGAGLLGGILSLYLITRIPEPRMSPVESETHLLELLLRPLRDLNFRRLILFLSTWSFAINLAAPFFTVYLLREIGFSLTTVIALSVLSQLVNILFLRIWGEMSDRLSNKSVLALSGPLLLVSVLAWTFTTLPDRYVLTIPLLVAIHILMGISIAGVTLAAGNIVLKLAPRGQSTAYLATSNLWNSVAAGIAPIVGGLLADFFARRELSWTLSWTGPSAGFSLETLNFQHWDFLFFIAFLIGVYAIHRLALVREPGRAPESETAQGLVREVRRSMRSFSTFGGLRTLVQFPFSLVRDTYTRSKRANRN